ncbi:MAG: ABC transporter permease [Candidatus Eisenbacteria sp.]|nr:ABC transporter permease [Candidatus Eisenbacteria bacterium]
MVHRILRVASREYLAYVRTRMFIVSVLALPLMLMLAFALPVLLESMDKPPRFFTIVDETGYYAADLLNIVLDDAEAVRRIVQIGTRDYVYLPPAELNLPEDPDARLVALNGAVQAGRLFAFLLISSENSDDIPVFDYYTVDPSVELFPGILKRAANEVLALGRLLPLVGDKDLVLNALHGVQLRTHAVTEEGEEVATAAHVARAYAPMAFVYLLWISVLTMSSHLMTSTIEEKASRIIEVLLSSISPFEFMMGKLGGLAGAGLTMMGTWVLTGVAALSLIQNPTVHQVGMGIASTFTGLTFFWFCLFYVLGFLFFSAIFVGVGSVCNTIREAQSLVQPIMIIMIIPLLLMVYVTSNPDHIVAVIASFFPPFTPFVIMNRIPANPPAPLWQVVVAALVLLGSTWWVIRMAAKVFRIGILMYGKPPTLPEILHWARRSE